MPAPRRFNILAGALIAVGLTAGGNARPVLAGAASRASRVVAHSTPLGKAAAASAYGRLPLAFEPNVGQATTGVDYVARGAGYAVALRSGGPTLVLPGSKKGSTSVVTMDLVGANATAPAAPGDALAGKVNYLVGRDTAKWHTGVPTYGGVAYHGVYRGVDARYYGNQGKLEYDLTVAPGADAGAITLGFDGVTRVRLDSKGEMVATTAGGDLRQPPPHIYQDVAGVRREIAGRFVMRGAGRFGFATGAYDHARPLVIDPFLAYSTFLGNPDGYDRATAIAVDGAGDAYVTGDTDTGAFPVTAGAFQTTRPGNYSAFVTKLNAAGTALVYSTYVSGGADGSDVNPHGIAVDTAGHAFVTGDLNQSDYPTTPGAFQTTMPGNGDAYVTELKADGSGLVYSTFLGNGDGIDRGMAIAVDASGDAYVTGDTDTGAFPTTPGAFQATRPGNYSAFVTKINATGTTLLYSTYVSGGANGGDINPQGIAIDTAGHAYVTGYVEQSNYPTTPGAFQTMQPGSPDAYVTKVNATGTALLYSTYLGNPGYDAGTAIAVDTAGDAYITGDTDTGAFPTTHGAYQATRPGNLSAFVTKLNPAGTAPVYSTYLSGADGSNINPHGIAIDPEGHAFVVGDVQQSDYPVTPDALQPSPRNGYVSELSPTGTGLDYSTYVGGTAGGDTPLAIAFSGGSVYFAGVTNSPDMPTTPGAFQTTMPGGGADAFVAQINFHDLLSISKTASPALVAAGGTITYKLSVHNDGTAGPATGVKVTDPLPTGVTFVSAKASQGTCNQSSGTVTCALGGIVGNAAATVAITVIAPNSSTKLTNTATVAANETDPNPFDNTATTVVYVNSADLSITKQGSPNPAVANRLLTYTLIASNLGPANATGVKVVDPLPTGLVFRSAVASLGACHQSSGTVTCTVGPLASGQTAVVTVKVTAPDYAVALTNTATISGDQVDHNTADNTATATSAVGVPNCGLVITRSRTLTADVGPCPGTGLIIGANNITLDLGGHRIFGSGPTDGTHPGVLLQGHTGVTIRNGEISDFDAGVFINLADFNTVTKLKVHDNIGLPSFGSYLGDGIAVFHSSANQILNNIVTHNGPHDGIGVFGLDSTNNEVDGNKVRQSVGSAADGLGGEGIAVSAVLEPGDPRRGQSITGNSVKHNEVTDNQASGILLLSDTNAKVFYNDVERNGLGNTVGPRNGIEIRFDSDGGARPGTRDGVRYNKVVGNGDNGIMVVSHANAIVGNTTGADNANNSASFDLLDTNPTCDTNTWSANTWGPAGFSPTCASAGGSGPAPASASQQRLIQNPAGVPPSNKSNLDHFRAR